jgi:hypothetical protein
MVLRWRIYRRTLRKLIDNDLHFKSKADGKAPLDDLLGGDDTKSMWGIHE